MIDMRTLNEPNLKEQSIDVSMSKQYIHLEVGDRVEFQFYYVKLHIVLVKGNAID